MSTQHPHILRPEATDFLTAIVHAIEHYRTSPAIFHLWGDAGVGKTTLVNTFQSDCQASVDVARVDVAQMEFSESPIGLMATLYEQAIARDASNDVFWTQYHLYKTVLQQLDTIAEDPEQSAEIKEKVAELLHYTCYTQTHISDDVDHWGHSPSETQLNNDVPDRSFTPVLNITKPSHQLTIDISTVFSVDSLRHLSKVPQQLIFDPLAQLTTAFVDGLKLRSHHRPLVLVLDEYEHISPTVSQWLQYVLKQFQWAESPIRWVIAGRYPIDMDSLDTPDSGKTVSVHASNSYLNRCDWSVHHLQSFTIDQVQRYLEQAELAKLGHDTIQAIYTVTQGSPIRLSWLVEQYGSEAIATLLSGETETIPIVLAPLTRNQRQLLYLVACCHWFDRPLIQHLAAYQGLDFGTAVDDGLNCFGWLVRQHWIEPIRQDWRIKKIVRDDLHRYLWQTNSELAIEIHQELARYFQHSASQSISSEVPLFKQYINADWRAAIAKSLYHAVLGQVADVQTRMVSYLLEAHAVKFADVIQNPLNAIVAEGFLSNDLDDDSPLSSELQRFLFDVIPIAQLESASFDKMLVHSSSTPSLERSSDHLERAMQYGL
ncbi:MAG: AAA family ATPase, partial [Cyanobacteria bacterium J06627_8]